MKTERREDRADAGAANEVRVMDFGHDRPGAGWRLRVLTVVDTWSAWSPISPAVDPRFSSRGEDIVPTPEDVCGRLGYPKMIRARQGTEFVFRDIALRAYYRKGVALDVSRQGKPAGNASIEASNSTYRQECLDARRHRPRTDGAPMATS